MTGDCETYLLTFLALVAISCTAISPPGDLPDVAPTTNAVMPAVNVMARVVSVADGDSFRAVMNKDPVGNTEVEVRLVGINAPELDECYGAESAGWLEETIGNREIGLALDPQPDQFGRLLAKAVVDNVFVNLDAVASGHALVVRGDDVDREALLEAEDAARIAGIGIWGDEICGARGAKAALEIVDLQFNPPGPDDEESVTIENVGDKTVATTGFILRDESSVNRFQLPSFAFPSGDQLTVFVGSCKPIYPSFTVTWCSDEPVWNNQGDTALLLDAFGRIVAFLRY